MKTNYLILLLFGFCFMASSQTLVTCQTCKGFGTYSSRERVPVRKDVTYRYVGSLTKTSTYVHYDTRHVERTCYVCNGSGQVVLQPRPPRKAKPKPTTLPPPPPTLKDNLYARFGFGYKLDKTTVGSERLRIVTYVPKHNVRAKALIRITGNRFEVILENYASILLLRNEYDEFEGLLLQDRSGMFAMADDQGRIVYRTDNRFDKINSRGDIWQGTDRMIEVGGKKKQEYKLINYKTKQRLSPGISLDDYCECKELWTEKGLIDVELPHAVLGDRTARGLMNSEGEILVPPIFDRVLDCSPSLGLVRFIDEEGYVYDFDYLGRLLTPSQERRTESCGDGRQLIYTKTLFLNSQSSHYKKEELELVDRVVIHHPDNPAMDGLVFREADCPNENGWARVLPANDDKPLYLHPSGKIASGQEKALSNVDIGQLPKVTFQRNSEDVSETWFVTQKAGNLVGGRLAYRDKDGELAYRTVKPAYQRIVSRNPQQVLVQAPNGLWGILAKTATLKPKYEELYQIRLWSYLGVKKGETYLITFDYKKQRFKTEAASKFSVMKQGSLRNLLHYNRGVPHIPEFIGIALKNRDISTKAPITGREIIIEQPGDRRHQAYWVSQGDRNLLILVMDYNEFDREKYYYRDLPPGTNDVADARYLEDKKGYLYIPYRVGDGPYRLLEYNEGFSRQIKDPYLEFDAVYAVPVATDTSPHTLVFEKEEGYFTLTREARGLTTSGEKKKKLGLQLLGVK